MNIMPQTASIKEMKTNADAIFRQASESPVLILNRSTTTAVIVSPEWWNQTTKRLSYLEQKYLCDRLSREMDEDPAENIPFTKAELIDRGIIDG